MFTFKAFQSLTTNSFTLNSQKIVIFFVCKTNAPLKSVLKHIKKSHYKMREGKNNKVSK